MGFLRLVRQSGFLSAALFLLIAIPLFILMDWVLELWLGTPPEGTSAVCRVMLVGMAVNRLTTGQQLALNARGRIAGWQMTTGCIWMMSVPVAAVFAWSGCGMTSAAWAYLVSAIGCGIANLLFARRLV